MVSLYIEIKYTKICRNGATMLRGYVLHCDSIERNTFIVLFAMKNCSTGYYHVTLKNLQKTIYKNKPQIQGRIVSICNCVTWPYSLY